MPVRRLVTRGRLADEQRTSDDLATACAERKKTTGAAL